MDQELWDRQMERLKVLVKELNEALGFDTSWDSKVKVTFGYIGNYDGRGGHDSRIWSVYLPHPWGVGKEEDRIGAFSTGDCKGAAQCAGQVVATLKVLRMAKAVSPYVSA